MKDTLATLSRPTFDKLVIAGNIAQVLVLYHKCSSQLEQEALTAKIEAGFFQPMEPLNDPSIPKNATS